MSEHGTPTSETEHLPEGPEAPPRGVAVMAVVRWLLLAGITALAVGAVWRFWGPGASAQSSAEARYYCPMHPQIRSADPGECPICHMNLEPIPAERTQATGPMSAARGADAGAHAHDPAHARDGGGPAQSVTGDAGPATVVDAGAPELVPVTVSLERQQLVGVVTSPVTRRSVGDVLRAPGVVEAPEDALAQVHVRAAGFLERVDVRETGVRVARGQTLAWLYSPQIYQAQQELLTATRWTAQNPGTSESAATQPAAMARAARQSLLLLGLTDGDVDGIVRRAEPLRAVPVRAPRAGYITRRAAVLGMYAMPETVLYEIAGLSEVWVVASLYASDLGRVRRGTAARFLVPSAEGGGIDARVDLVEPRVGAETRTARVRLAVRNPDLRLRPGQYGDVVFALPGATALVVPRDAVIDTGRAQYVFVAGAGGRFEPRVVRTGTLVDGHLVVSEGLREGEQVVARGAFMIDSESRLQAALTAAPAPAAPAPAAHAGHGGAP